MTVVNHLIMSSVRMGPPPGQRQQLGATHEDIKPIIIKAHPQPVADQAGWHGVEDLAQGEAPGARDRNDHLLEVCRAVRGQGLKMGTLRCDPLGPRSVPAPHDLVDEGPIAWQIDALGRRPGQGDGRGRHVQEPGQPPLRRNRRACERFPVPASGGRVALSLARCDLPQGPRGREDHQPCRDNRRGGQRGRQARGVGRGHRSLGGRNLLDRVPAQPRRPRPARGEAGDRRRSQGPAGRRTPRVQR